MKVNFTENSPTIKTDSPEYKFRPQFRTDSSENTFPVKFGTDSARTTFPVEFGEVHIVKESAEPAYGKVQNGDTIYNTLDSALAEVKSGETIVLLSDINYKAVFSFTTAFCLDLNGYTLKAEGLAVLAQGGSVVDTGELKGLLEVPKGSLVMNHAVYGMLPVWNEEGTGYFFAKVIDQSKPVEILGEDSFVVEFRPSISGGGVVTSQVLGDGVKDNDLTFKVEIKTYDEGGNLAQTIAPPPIADELISDVYTNSTSVRYTVNGVRHPRCVVELVIESEAGLVYRSEQGSFEKQ